MLQPVSMFAQVIFDIAIYCSTLSMSNITIHKLHFVCLWICFWINIFTQIVNGIVCIVWDETFSICSSQMSPMGTGIGVIFQRTKSCSQFYCSGDNTYRQYYQQKALDVHNNISLLHYCCKPCIWCDNWPDLMGRLLLWYGYLYGIKTIFCKWKYNLQTQYFDMVNL